MAPCWGHDNVQDEAFEWDDEKTAGNWQKHAVAFEDALVAFDDRNCIEELTDEEGEERWMLKGMADGRVLVVIYVERDGRFRIISARKANKREQSEYFGASG